MAMRWALVVGLVAVGALVAVRPWSDQPAAPDAGESAAVSRQQPSLDELRRTARLEPCPTGTGDGGQGPLAGLRVPCLGAPGTVDLGAALAGRPALLNLWGPLCAPCREELPALQAYRDTPGSVPVIGVEVQNLPEGGLALLAELGVRYPSVSDPDRALRGALGSPPVLPLSYVVYPDGTVVQVNPPEVMRTPEQVRATVDRYLTPGDG